MHLWAETCVTCLHLLLLLSLQCPLLPSFKRGDVSVSLDSWWMDCEWNDVSGIINKHLVIHVFPLFFPFLNCFDGDKVYIVSWVATVTYQHWSYNISLFLDEGKGLSFYSDPHKKCIMCVCVCVHSVVSDSLQPHGPPGSSVHGISQARILEWVAISSSKGTSWPRGLTCVSCFGRQILYHCATWKAQCIMWKVKVKVAQLCLTLCDPMDCIVYGILQARILEWVAVPFSRGSSQPRDQTQVSCIASRFFTSWATREAQYMYMTSLHIM